jgi:hypothetical protein
MGYNYTISERDRPAQTENEHDHQAHDHQAGD